MPLMTLDLSAIEMMGDDLKLPENNTHHSRETISACSKITARDVHAYASFRDKKDLRSKSTAKSRQ